MATKKQKVDKLGNTMEDYDRWGTPKGVQKTTSKPTAAQKKLAARVNAERAATAKAKKGAKKAKTK